MTASRLRGAAVAVLLGGPTALAFRSGGFFDEPRIVAGLVALVLVTIVALTPGPVLPRSAPGRVALAGLVGLAAWTLASWSWTPLEGPAQDDLQRLVLYAAVFVAAIALLRGDAARDALEPALAGGALLVVAYGLSERLLPGLIELHRSTSAGGRLEQPLTYWNAMGALAATGLVLCARMAGDPTRSERLRELAAVAAAPLGAGVYLSYSRGALLALAAGLGLLLILTPRREQARAVALCLATASVASLAAGGLRGVRAFAGSSSTREAQGIALLALLALLAGWAVLASRWLRREEVSGRLETATLRLAVSRRWLVAGALVVLLAGVAATAAVERPRANTPAYGASAQRLGSTESNRYAYWKVAVKAFAHHPVQGLGSGGFRVEWRRERKIADPAIDAHSLYLETAAELGLVGLLLLAAFVLGTGAAALEARRRAPAATAGLLAALSVLALHAGLDWDWEMPALALVAIVLAGALVATAEEPELRTPAD